jgi:hypothetical protein
MEEDEVVQLVLREVARRSLFGSRSIPLGDDFVIKVERDWTEPGQDVTDQIKLTLMFTGPAKRNIVLELKCDGMLEVMANAAKLIEDRKKLKWNKRKEVWGF